MVASSRLSRALALLLSGCSGGNACQQLCDLIADYAANECSQEFPDDQVAACKESNQTRKISETKLTNCEYALETDITAEWSCEDDIALYFDEEPSDRR